jgi:hypothetical protein
MPTPAQLAEIDPTPGDGSTSTTNDDGSTTISWPDGTTRVDEPDGSSIITFPDDSVLNLNTDGTRTLNDAAGNPLDPSTGQPLGGGSQGPPTPPPTSVQQLTEFVEGASAIGDLAQASGILRGLGVAAAVDQQYSAVSELASALADALTGEISPVAWFKNAVLMLLNIIKAIQTEERGVSMRAWCYTVVYDAMGMGTPPEPTFSGSLQGPDQDATDQKSWDNSVIQATQQLGDGSNGTALRNRVLLLIAKCSADPAQAVTELWANACAASDDSQLLQAYPNLGWPQPTGA